MTWKKNTFLKWNKILETVSIYLEILSASDPFTLLNPCNTFTAFTFVWSSNKLVCNSYTIYDYSPEIQCNMKKGKQSYDHNDMTQSQWQQQQ